MAGKCLSLLLFFCLSAYQYSEAHVSLNLGKSLKLKYADKCMAVLKFRDVFASL